MRDDIPSTTRYAGGQACPGCERAVSAAARYCQWCGTCLDATLPDALGPSDVFCGDEVHVVLETSTERFLAPAAHPDREGWHVTGRVYGMQRLRVHDRRDELRLEYDDRRESWNVLGSMRTAQLYPAAQDDCSPAEWPTTISTRDLQAALDQEGGDDA